MIERSPFKSASFAPSGTSSVPGCRMDQCSDHSYTFSLRRMYSKLRGKLVLGFSSMLMTLKMDVPIGRISRSCFYQLRQTRTIRQSLSDNATGTLIHSFVVTRVNYCNSVLSGITAVLTETDRTRILNAAARLVLRIPKFVPVSALIRDSLHWLPAAQRIKFWILLIHSCKLHQPKCTVVSAGTLCAGFSGAGASALTVC